MDVFFAVVLFSGLGVALVAVILVVRRVEKKRHEDMTDAAAELGMAFPESMDMDLMEKLQALPMFNRGRRRKTRNVMTTGTELADMTIFDYQFTTGGGKHQQTHRHTVIALESDSMDLPNFTLRPEGFFQKLGAALGFQDIDFDDHPDFSKSFVLKGEDETSIREFFDVEMLDLFAQHQGICVESAPGIFIYLRGRRWKPEQLRDFILDAHEIYSSFARRLKGAE